MPSPKPAYKRILLKISGESFLGDVATGIDFNRAVSVAREIKEVHDLGVDVAVMIGGGNLFRGAKGIKEGIDQGSADQMGMLATVINGIALQESLEHAGVDTRHISAIEIKAVAEPFIRRRAVRHLEKRRILIFSAGIGSPYFTTDTAAALRALEIRAEVIMKATKVDGVYSADPMVDKNARKFGTIGYQDVLRRRLRVMDATAISLCRENNMPIIVFNLNERGNIMRAVLGEKVGTLVHGKRGKNG